MTDGVKIDLNSNKEDPIIDLLRLNGAMDLDHIQDMTGYDVATITKAFGTRHTSIF